MKKPRDDEGAVRGGPAARQAKLESTPLSTGSARHPIEGSLSLSIRQTDCSDSVMYLSGTLSPTDVKGPRCDLQGDELIEEGGNAAAELALLALFAHLNPLVLQCESRLEPTRVDADTQSSSPIDMYIAAAEDCNLLTLLVQALASGIARPFSRPAQSITDAEFAELSMDQRGQTITPTLIKDMLCKLTCPTYGAGNSQGHMSSILRARGVADSVLVEVLQMTKVTMAKSTMDRAYWNKLGTEAKYLLDGVGAGGKDFALTINFDNVNILKPTGIYETAADGENASMVQNFVVFVRSYHEYDAIAEALGAERLAELLTEPNRRRTSREELLVYYDTSESGGFPTAALETRDQAMIDMHQLARVVTLFDDVRCRAVEVDPDYSPLGGIKHEAGMELPGRGGVTKTSLANVEALGQVQGGAAGFEQRLPMNPGPAEIWHANLSETLVVKSTADWLEEQVRKALPKIPGTNLIDPESLAATMGAYLHSDGDPTAKLIRLFESTLVTHPERYKYVRVEGAHGLHLLINALRTCRRLTRSAFLESLVSRFRTGLQTDYYFKCPNPDQITRESHELVAAMYFDAGEALESDPEWRDADGKVKPYTAADVLGRMERRFAKSDLLYLVGLELRFIETISCLEEAALNGGNRADFDSCWRLLAHWFAVTHAPNYMLIALHNNLHWKTECDVVRAVYPVALWLGETSTGQTCYKDDRVETVVANLKGSAPGATSAAGLAKVLARAGQALEVAAASRPMAARNAVPTTDGPTQGRITTTRNLEVLRKAIKEHNLNGHGGIDTPVSVFVKDDEGEPVLTPVGVDRAVSLNNEALVPKCSEVMVVASERVQTGLKQYFKNPMAPLPKKHWAAVQMVQGDEAQMRKTEAIRLTTSSVMVMESMRCPATNDKVFTKKTLSAALADIRDNRGHRTVDGEFTPHPAGCPHLDVLLTRRYSADLAATASGVFSQPKATEMMKLLSALRTAAAIVEVSAAAEAAELPEPVRHGAPSAAAIAHQCWHNGLAEKLCGHAGEVVTDACVFQGHTLPVYGGEQSSMRDDDARDGEAAVSALADAFGSLASADAMGDAGSL
eukprot:m.347226 g.347226  ORF g.347226 m.347226 type:complete len:1077 (-) comp27919_c1_seq7:37-3267(-)